MKWSGVKEGRDFEIRGIVGGWEISIRQRKEKGRKGKEKKRKGKKRKEKKGKGRKRKGYFYIEVVI